MPHPIHDSASTASVDVRHFYTHPRIKTEPFKIPFRDASGLAGRAAVYYHFFVDGFAKIANMVQHTAK